MIKIRHVVLSHPTPGGIMLHEYKETTVDSVVELTKLGNGIWQRFPAFSLGSTMQGVIDTYLQSGWAIHNDNTVLKVDEPVQATEFKGWYDTPKTTEKHKCKCDLTGANCWLGCRCGGA